MDTPADTAVKAEGAHQGGGVSVLAQFFSADGQPTGPQLDLPLETTPDQLQLLLNDLLAQVRVPATCIPLPSPSRVAPSRVAPSHAFVRPSNTVGGDVQGDDDA